MLDCTNKPEAKCDPKSDDLDPEGRGCGSDFAYFYFITFFIVCSFLILMPVFEEPEVSIYQLESVNNLRFKSDFRLCVFLPILVRLQ